MARSVADIQADLDLVREAMAACLQTGQKYTLAGGASAENVSFEVLERREARLVKELDAASSPRGVDTGRHVANVREGWR